MRVELGRIAAIPPDGSSHRRKQMADELESAIELCLDELGVPSALTIELATTNLPQVMRLLINGRYHSASRELLVAAWQQTGAQEPELHSAHGFADWLRRGLAENLAHWFAAGSSDAGRQAMDFLKAVTASIVRRHVDELFGAEQAARLLAQVASMKSAFGPDGREAARSFEPARLVAVVRPLLWVGISLRDRAELVQQAVSDGLVRKTGDAVVAESLMGNLASKPTIRVSPQDYRQLSEKHEARLEADAIATELGEPLSLDLGISPRLVFGPGNDEKNGTARVIVNDQPCAAIRMTPADTVLVKLRPNELPGDVQDARSWIMPDGNEGSIVPEHLLPRLQAEGFAPLGPLEYVLDAASRAIRRNAWRLITADAVETQLSLIAESHPDLALAAARAVSSPQLTQVLRSLLREQVSIRDLVSILERIVTFRRVIVDEWEYTIFDDRLPVHPRLANISSPELDHADLVRYVRLGVRRVISHAHRRGQNTVAALWLDTTAIKDRLLEHLAASYGASGASLLDAETLDQIRAAISGAVSRYMSDFWRPVVLTPGCIRSLVRDLVADEFPDLAILAYGEIDPRIVVQQLGQVTLGK